MKSNFPEAVKQIDHIADFWLPLKIKYDRMPGISLGIVYKGKLLYKNGFGFADVEKRQYADEETLYHIASNSKMFTAVSIMQLVERGELRLDDRVVSHISWFNAKNKDADAAHITIRQLLSHTSGIFRDGDTAHWETGKFPKDLQSSFSNEALRFENLTSFKYANYGYAILGEIIKKISGLSYEEYVEKNILYPLGMNNTFPDYKDNLTHVATGYGRNIPDENRQRFSHYKTYAYAAATGFVSNVVDLSKFVFALSLEGKDKILTRGSKKEMMHPYEKTMDGDEYGLGIEITQIKGRKIVGHGGGFNGFITKVMWDAQSDLGVIVLSNSLDSSAGGIARGIFETIYEFLDKRVGYMENKKIKYSAYEGIYRSVWSDEVVARIGNTLVGFGPKTDSPLRWSTIFIPEKKPHQFLMKDKNVFNSANEVAAFASFKSGKAQKVLLGATPSKRIFYRPFSSNRLS
jgi:CubicO group peptidase (beta-lactamase class C family)